MYVVISWALGWSSDPCSAVCDLLLLIMSIVQLKILWSQLQRMMAARNYAMYIPFVYFGSQHICFLHCARAAGFAGGCPLSTDTSWRNKSDIHQQIKSLHRCCSLLVAKVVDSTCVGRCLIPSSDMGPLLKFLFETVQCYYIITIIT